MRGQGNPISEIRRHLMTVPGNVPKLSPGKPCAQHQ
jgi:hypothetical protein